VYAQEFKLFDRRVQIHGFASQGFVYTDQNNWLTMPTSQGSGAFTDFGANISMQVTGRLRIGAQVYDRNIGNLGDWHPSLDWAFADYRFKPWFGIRGGKVKTALGLYNDTQDLDFLHPFALLPQSIYPTDMRDSTIAHTGGDVYGNIPLGERLGTLSYTGYAGQRQDSLHGGYPYLLAESGIELSSYGGLQYGGDLRWATPLKGLLVGVSRVNEDVSADGMIKPGAPVLLPPGPFHEASKADWINQYYAQYARNKLEFATEYRRSWRDEIVFSGRGELQTDVRAWYVSGAYRFNKWFQAGSYLSEYYIKSPFAPPVGVVDAHIFDKVITGRVDLNRFFNLKVEGHFINGYGAPYIYPDGFYFTNNTQNLKPNTNALVVRTGFDF
jgi:hypothetical protein